MTIKFQLEVIKLLKELKNNYTTQQQTAIGSQDSSSHYLTKYYGDNTSGIQVQGISIIQINKLPMIHYYQIIQIMKVLIFYILILLYYIYIKYFFL